MLYTCCNSSRNTWRRCLGCCGVANTTNGNGCGCGCGNTTNTTNTNGSTNTFVNGVYGVFFPIANRSCCLRRTTTLDCGNVGTWTNTTNGNGCGCGCRRNLCTTNTAPTVIDGDAYYAHQYGLNTHHGCGCGFGDYGNVGFNGFSTDD